MINNSQTVEHSLNLREVAEKLNGFLVAEKVVVKNAVKRIVEQGPSFSNLSIDSRSINAGDLYIAIRGDRYDGHDYVRDAMEKGAVACVVEHKIEALKQFVQLVVRDTKLALGKIASLYREKHQITLVAITGSCGKTTLKEMLYSILEKKFPGRVLSTRGNLNNEFGVPLTLMQLKQKHQAAVIEMGANHLQEIAYLAEIAKPDIAVVTNAGNAHIEGFGSQQQVAQGKGEVYLSLPEQGYAIINNDDDYASYWKNLSHIKQEKLRTFAIKNEADVIAKQLANADQDWTAITAKGDFKLNLPVPGKHNVLNALAAIAVCQLMDVSNEQIQQGLKEFVNVSGRLEISAKQKRFTLINDTYNANPESVKAAIDVLASYLHPDKYDKVKTILVLGDMGELGKEGKELHQQIGEYAASKNINALYAVGNLSQYAVESFQQHIQQQHQQAKYFNNVSELKKLLVKKDFNGSVVLVKGSRKMAMESMVHVLEQQVLKKPILEQSN